MTAPEVVELAAGEEYPVRRDAVLSADGLYRWWLLREWLPDRPTMAAVLLNPSTADADKDDPTVRRCMRYAHREGCGALVIVNLFGRRATVPAELAAWAVAGEEVVGADNEEWLAGAVEDADVVLAGWGAGYPRTSHGDHVTRWRELLRAAGAKALQHTAKGDPRHPLYLPKDAPLVPL